MADQSGGKWLAQFLYNKGLRGAALEMAWAIAMRESGGRPTIDNSGMNGDGSVDYGLFQINSTHRNSDLFRRNGWTMEDMRDPDKNFEAFKSMSGNFKNFSAWGMHNLDGSISGWAASLPASTVAGFEATVKKNRALFRQDYASIASAGGGGTNADGSASDPVAAAEQQRVLNDAAKWARRKARKDVALGYSGLCDHFVGQAYGLAHSGYETAIAHWNATPDKYRNAGDREPPPGALVFWSNDSAGHVAISLGNGKIVSTDITRNGYADIVDLKAIENNWHMKYEGWATPYFGGKAYKMGTDGISGAAQATTGSGVGDGTGASTGEDMPDTPEEWAQRFGYPLALIDSNKSLKELFDRAVTNEYDETRFTAELRGTKWYQNHREVWRQAEALKYQDPATYQANVASLKAKMRSRAVEMGSTLSETALTDAANKAIHFGWDESKVNQFLAPFIKSYEIGGMRGEAGEIEDQLRELSFKNGIDMSTDYYLNAARTIGGGTSTLETQQDMIRQRAMGMWPGWAKEIQAGQDMIDLASPYIQSMAQNFEVDPGTITLNDPYIRGALSSRNSTTNAYSPTSLTDFERKLKQDARYQYTKKSMNETTSLIGSIRSAFGF